MGSVIRVPDLRRVEFAFAFFGLAEYSTWVAILVYAFELAGATGTGVVAMVQLIPSALAAPMASAFGDLVGRRRSLIAGYATQAVSMGAVALALAVRAPVALVIALAAVAATTITFTRPAHWAIQASLAETPEQLTAANVMSASIQNAAVLAGPALAGALLAFKGPDVVFAVAGGSLALAALLVAGVRRPPPSPVRTPLAEVVRESRAGLERLVEEPRTRLVVGVMALRSVCVGALDVLAVVLALSFLDIGRSGAGYLTAAFGAGALAGAAGALALVGRTALSRPLRAGLAVCGLAVAAIASVRSAVIAFPLLAVSGVGDALTEVSGRTLLQRLTPDLLLTRVFGVLEGLDMAALGIGSIGVSLLIDAIGVRWALVTLGLLLPFVAMVVGRRVRPVDFAARVDPSRVRVLRSVAMFRPLDPPTLERLAIGLTFVEAHEGDVVIQEGDPGDRLYVIADGTVEVTRDGRTLAKLGPGDYFGEMALLHDAPRNATVTCLETCRLYALEREPFLTALGRFSVAASRAEAVVRHRSVD